MIEQPVFSEASEAGPELIAYPLDLGQVQTRVLQWGMGPRNVIFLHGAGARADRWSSTMKALDPELYRAIAIDFPGHGFATKGSTPDYSIPAFADLVTDLVKRLDLERPALVGTSMGGHVAATVVTRDPGSIIGLALVGSVGLVPIPEEINQLIAAALTATERAHIVMKLNAVLCNAGLITEALVEAEWRINNSAGASEGFAALAQYWREQHASHLVGPALAALQGRPPLRLIWGEEDRSTPLTMGIAAADLLTGGELFTLPGAGHAPYLDTPEAFCAALIPFLEGLWRAPAMAGHSDLIVPGS